MIDEVEPNEFSKWVFPLLFRSRIPKYERLAAQYGVTVSSDNVWNIKSEDDFLRLIE